MFFTVNFKSQNTILLSYNLLAEFFSSTTMITVFNGSFQLSKCVFCVIENELLCYKRMHLTNLLKTSENWKQKLSKCNKL